MSLEDKISLLVKKLQDELDEYKELEQYAPNDHPKGDRRYSLSVRIIALTEDGDMDMDEEVLDALLEIDGVLGYCWDIYGKREVPVDRLFRELLYRYRQGEVC